MTPVFSLYETTRPMMYTEALLLSWTKSLGLKSSPVAVVIDMFV
jgi:hypothetical protein